MTMRPFTDARGGLNHLVDAQIGRAFPVVHKVYQHLDAIEYVAQVYEAGRARDIVLRTNHTKEWIEWQYKGEAKWTILFKFSDLLGADIADVVAAEQAIATELVALREYINQTRSDTLAASGRAQAAELGAVVAKDAAETAQADAETAEALARAWATKIDGPVLNDGVDKFSAQYWATQSEQSALDAADANAGAQDALANHTAAADPHTQYLTKAESTDVLATKVDAVMGKQLSTEDYTTPEKSKLAGIAPGATANATDAQLRDRTTHTGEQAISTVTGLQLALDSKESAGTAAAAIAAHVATSDPHPNYTTTAEASAAAPVQSVAGKTGAVTLAKTDVGLANVDNTSDANKPVSAATQTALNTKVDKVAGKQLSTEDYTSAEKAKLASVENGANAYIHPAKHPASIITQDENNRFVTDAEKAAWNTKQAALVSGENIKTINGMSILGGGDIVITNGDELAVPRLNSLLVYYGYPIAYKGIWNADAIVAEISASHDYWVVGHTYQDPAHAEYASTVAIMRGVRAAGVKLYGYIPLGTNSYNYTVAQIEAITDQWMAIGVDGIFIDEYGFDYGNTRQRQVDVVNMIHTKGLPICANAWVMEEFVTDSLAETGWPSGDWRYARWQEWNPTNIPSPAQPGDSYLFENFCYNHLGPTAVWDTQERAERARALALQNDVSVWGVAVFAETTPGTLDTAKLGSLATLPAAGEYISANAYLYDISVVGSGGFSFGANGTPLWAPLRQLSESAQLPVSPAKNNYTDKTGVRSFGPVRVKVINSATIQAVEVRDVTPLRLGGGDLVVAGGPTLQGNTSPYANQTETYQVTNYNSFSSYAVSASAGTASISGDTITYTAPATAGSVDLTLTVDGQPTVFAVAVQAGPSYIPTPTPTPTNFGDPLEGGFYAGMMWGQIAQSSTSMAIATGSKTFTVPSMTSAPIVYVGQMVEVRSRANPANKFVGTVTSAAGTSLTINVTSIGGSGTFSDWSVMARHRVIVAPKASGEHAGIALKNANTALPTACQTLTEGFAATQAMRDADSSTVYPAAHWARNLNIGGRTDWYIPARDESELCWRNLKPNSTGNYTPANRPTGASFNYANNGSYGDTANTHGRNNNSAPPGAAYTADAPEQAAAPAFRTGGAEAFEFGSAYYWSSSEYSASSAWFQYWFSSYPGVQDGLNKNTAFRVRAVRRSVI